jgi:hypothetical protein
LPDRGRGRPSRTRAAAAHEQATHPDPEKQPRPFPNWLRQRVEAVIWTLKNQLGLERHGAPVKRSLIAYDHV